MKKIVILLIGIGLFSCKTSELESVKRLSSIAEENLIAASYVVKLRDDKYVPMLVEFQKTGFQRDSTTIATLEIAKKNEIQDFASGYGLTILPENFYVYASSGFFIENLDMETLGDLIEDTVNVQSVQQDFTFQDIRARMQQIGPFPEDIRARMQDQWGYDPTGFTSRAVTFVGGGANPVTTSRKIWIVDSGIDANHQDLRDQLTSGLDISWVTTSVDEANPKIDFSGHGTHCAGLAAGKAFNLTLPPNPYAIGMNGVSPGAQLVSLKVFANDRTARWNWIEGALEYVAENSRSGDVVSMSLGGYVGSCNAHRLDVPLANLSGVGVFVVMAAGNGENGVGVYGNKFLPGCVDGIAHVYTIGSMRIDFEYPSIPKSFSVFSNFGSNVDYVAPGEMIFSTFPGDTYAVTSGTSAATAIVAGIIHANGGPPINSGVSVVGPPGTSTYIVGKRNP